MEKTSSLLIGVAAATMMGAALPANANQITTPVDPSYARMTGQRYTTRFNIPQQQVSTPATTTYYTYDPVPASMEEDGEGSAVHSIEITASYNFPSTHIMQASGRDSSPQVETVGIDASWLHHFNPHHAIVVRFSYLTGEDKVADEYETEKFRVNQLAFMPGYRYTRALTPTTSFFVGANVGINTSSLKYKDLWERGSESLHDSSTGFAYSAEIGLKLALTDSVDVSLGYRFSGSTARPILDDHTERCKTARQNYHSVLLGVSCSF